LRQLRLVSLALLAAAATSQAAFARPFTVDDLVTLRRITELDVSPKGDRIALVVRNADVAANRGTTDLYWMKADGGAMTALTSDAAADGSPHWAPDGQSIYFLSSRSGSNQVWRIPVGAAGTGAAVQVTDLALDVEAMLLSPDGQRLALGFSVYPDCDTLACNRKRIDAADQSKVKARFYEDGMGFVRHWDTWSDGRRNHVFVVGLKDGKAAGEPLDLSRGMKADTPSKPYGGSEEWAFSPDGKTLVFTARDVGREEPWSTNLDLFQVPVDGSRPPVNLTTGNKATDTQPVFSPDGKTLAYLAMRRPQYESDRQFIELRDVASGAVRTLAEGWDRSAASVFFSTDGKTLYTVADDLGDHPLFAVDVASGKVKKLAGDGIVATPALAGSRLVFGRHNLTSPTDLFSIAADGSDLRQLTAINKEAMAGVELGKPEGFTFPGAGGDPVHAWVVKPVGFQEGKKYPLALIIHGGPQVSMGNLWHYRWNPQVYAAAGYATLQVDFHGSPGYGQAFTDAIRQDWGGKPLEDIDKGLAAAIARYPWIDGDNACALGASYGGYMINWIAGQRPDRFRCLVNHDGTFDNRIMYYGTEEMWFPEWEQGGPYWEAKENHERQNPVNYVDRWKTPMLVIHGELDYRIDKIHGLAAYNVLQRRGIPGELLLFPDENHWVLRPANSVRWHQTVLSWLDRWLRPASSATRDAPAPSR
jgi:dipeptidyl aminopeptidase/acylaminoacyl peptidase